MNLGVILSKASEKVYYKSGKLKYEATYAEGLLAYLEAYDIKGKLAYSG